MVGGLTVFGNRAHTLTLWKKTPSTYTFSSILKSKKAFSPILFAKYLSQSSQFEQQKIIFFHFLLKSTYHDTLISIPAAQICHFFHDTSLRNIVPGFVPFFRNKFPGLFQASDWFFKGSKMHINPYTPKISMLILLTAFHTLHTLHIFF